MISNELGMTTLFNAALGGSGSASSNLDVSLSGGTAFYVIVSNRAGASNTVTVTIEHSATGTGDWTAVPASAVFSPSTGSEFAFAPVLAVALNQFLGVVTQQCKAYVRINMVGTTVSTHNFAVVATAQFLRSDAI